MKNLDKLIESEQLIIDTSLILGETCKEMCKQLYDCTESIYLSPEELGDILQSIGKLQGFFTGREIYVTPNTLAELHETLNILNYQQEFHAKRKAGKIKLVRGKRFFSRLDEDDKTYDNINQELLSEITNRFYCLQKGLEKRNIAQIVSASNTQKAGQMINFLKTLKNDDGMPVKQDYSQRYDSHFFKSKQSLNLDTDEEIVAYAIMLASKSPVTIITRDSDIRRMLRVGLRNPKFYERFWQDFPRQRIRVIAGYQDEDYKIVYDSDNPSLCRQAAENPRAPVSQAS